MPTHGQCIYWGEHVTTLSRHSVDIRAHFEDFKLLCDDVESIFAFL
jgi:hypothetical protein